MNKISERRLKENEVIFRRANTEVKKTVQELKGSKTKTTIPFFCECSDMNCREQIELTPSQYEETHKNPKQFIVIDGHEIPKIEKPVASRRKFNIVEKFGIAPEPNEA